MRDYNAELVERTLQDFRKSFSGLTPKAQAETLQCVLKQVTAYPDKFALDIYELAEFTPGSQKDKDWLCLADDFRTYFESKGVGTQAIPLPELPRAE